MSDLNPRIQNDAACTGMGPGTLITSATSNVTLSPCARKLIVSTGGTITGRMAGDTGDQAYIFPAGEFNVALKKITSATTIVAFALV
jgi:L-asparaginase/Glu-tRNA(Gln) amidotransferase subunit D